MNGWRCMYLCIHTYTYILYVSIDAYMYIMCMCRYIIYIYNGIILSHKKYENAICNNIDGLRDYHTKWSQKERQIPYDITYMWILKYNSNKLTYETETDYTDIGKKLTVTKGKRGSREG